MTEQEYIDYFLSKLKDFTHNQTVAKETGTVIVFISEKHGLKIQACGVKVTGQEPYYSKQLADEQIKQINREIKKNRNKRNY